MLSLLEKKALIKKKEASAQLPDSAVFFFACVGKFVITLRLTTWNGKNVLTAGLFLAFNNTLAQTLGHTAKQRVRSQYSFWTQRGVKAIAPLPTLHYHMHKGPTPALFQVLPFSLPILSISVSVCTTLRVITWFLTLLEFTCKTTVQSTWKVALTGLL